MTNRQTALAHDGAPRQEPAEAASERLSALAASVGELAHTFNNALTTVVGLTDWHLVAGEPSPALRSDLEKIRDAAMAAERTAREIQRLARSAADSAAPVRSASAPAEAAARRPSVLIVDDQADVRASLVVMVRTLGYEVQAVESGTAALEHVAGQLVDLVISDLTMPAMDGLALAARLQTERPGLPFVLLSGWTGSDQGAPPPGVARTMGKPVRMAALREALGSLLPLSS